MHVFNGMNLTRHLSLTRNKKRLTLVQEEHQRIVQAIRDSDEEGARAAMRAHISNARIRALDSTAEPL